MGKDRYEEIEVDEIKILDNVRIRDIQGDLGELMSNIKAYGLIQPIGVFQDANNKYVLLWGHRRVEAIKKLSWKTIPAIITDEELTEENYVLKNVSENIHRKDITLFELSKAVLTLRKQHYSDKEIASKLNMPYSKIRSAIKNLSQIPDEFLPVIKSFDKTHGIRNAKIPMSVANTIVNLRKEFNTTTETNRKMFRDVIEYQLKQSDLRIIAGLMRNGASYSEAMKERKKYVIYRINLILNEEKLQEELANRNLKGKTKGRVIIEEALNDLRSGLVWTKK